MPGSHARMRSTTRLDGGCPQVDEMQLEGLEAERQRLAYRSIVEHDLAARRDLERVEGDLDRLKRERSKMVLAVLEGKRAAAEEERHKIEAQLQRARRRLAEVIEESAALDTEMHDTRAKLELLDAWAPRRTK